MYTPNYKMAVARDNLGKVARKRGIEGQVTTIRHFGIRCMADLTTFSKCFEQGLEGGV